MTAEQDQRTLPVTEAQAVVPAAAAASGLTSADAAQRLARYGPNEVAEARPGRLLALARMFWGLVPWMLEAAIGVDLYLGRWVEAGVIGALLVFNAVLGSFQQARAQRAVSLHPALAAGRGKGSPGERRAVAGHVRLAVPG